MSTDHSGRIAVRFRIDPVPCQCGLIAKNFKEFQDSIRLHCTCTHAYKYAMNMQYVNVAEILICYQPTYNNGLLQSLSSLISKLNTVMFTVIFKM